MLLWSLNLANIPERQSDALSSVIEFSMVWNGHIFIKIVKMMAKTH